MCVCVARIDPWAAVHPHCSRLGRSLLGEEVMSDGASSATSAGRPGPLNLAATKGGRFLPALSGALDSIPPRHTQGRGTMVDAWDWPHDWMDRSGWAAVVQSPRNARIDLPLPSPVDTISLAAAARLSLPRLSCCCPLALPWPARLVRDHASEAPETRSIGQTDIPPRAGRGDGSSEAFDSETDRASTPPLLAPLPTQHRGLVVRLPSFARCQVPFRRPAVPRKAEEKERDAEDAVCSQPSRQHSQVGGSRGCRAWWGGGGPYSVRAIVGGGRHGGGGGQSDGGGLGAKSTAGRRQLDSRVSFACAPPPPTHTHPRPAPSVHRGTRRQAAGSIP